MKLFSKHVDDRLSEYIDRRLAPAEAARVEDHVARCAECGDRLAGLRQAIAALQTLPELEPPRSFAINEAMLMRPADTYRPPRWQPFAAPAAAMAVIFVLLLGGDLATSIESEDDEDVVEDAASQELIEMDALASEQEASGAEEESAPQEPPDTDQEATAGDDGFVPEEETTLADEEPTGRATADGDETEARPDPETVEQLENVDDDDDTFRLFVRLIEAGLAVGALGLGIVAFRRWREAR